MPSTRRANPVPSRITLSQPFEIPESTHLLITTPRHIFAWDAAGIRPVFRSRKGGIVAAREAKDGSGVLAVASSNVVVLHDTKRAKQESWGLSADQDEVRFLEYGPNAKSLFLTTTTDGAIQNYNIERSRLLEPAEKLATPPAALAVSPTGHLVLSASLNPPVIHLKNMTTNTASLRIHPNASSAPISCAVFHPERPNVFLIAYRDGTIAAYDASRLPKRDFGVHADLGLKDGEIGHFSNLHRGTVEGDSSLNKTTLAAPIIGIAFLPGFKTRAVTAGRDGKCKIIDFAKSGEVLRSWHTKAPLTSISVVAIKTETPSRSARDSRRSQASAHTIGGPTSTESMIALGRIDGKVQVYDTVGLLLAEQAIAGQEEKVLSVEWIKGESPQGFQGDGIERHFSAATVTSLKPWSTKVQPGLDVSKPVKAIEVPQTKSPNVIRSTRKLVVHPDEIEQQGTVRHTPAAKNAGKSMTAVVGYQDLFSPVKPETTRAATQELKPSPRKNRPRLSSQTFVKCPPVMSTNTHPASPRGLTILQPAESHATNSDSAVRRRRIQQTTYLKSARRTSRQFAQADNSVRRISFAQGTGLTGDGTMRSRQSAASTKPSADAKVLADIRRLAQQNTSQRNPGAVLEYAASYRHKSAINVSAQSQLQQSHNHPPAQRSQVHVSDPETWPTDSVVSSLADNEDIWLTSDSNDDTSKRRRRKARTMDRPPGRQTSRSRVDRMGGTMSTVISHEVANTIPSPSHIARVDGSTEDEMFSANSHLPSQGTFSPASEDVRELFPRSSSLSPRRRASPKRRNHGHVSPERKSLALTAMSLNQALGRQPKSPWAKAKASRRVPSPRKGASTMSKVQRSIPAANQDLPAMGDCVEGPSQCLTCSDTRVRVQSLENEVAMLKGEVLAMKAILRRNGLPFPACLR